MSATAGRLAPLLVALLAVAACHDVTEPVSEGAGPLQVLERPVTTEHDTVDAQLGGALRLAIYDSAGRRLPHAAVSIRAVSGDTTRGTDNAFAVFSHDSWWQVGTGPYSFAPWFITDSVGEVRIPIRLGTLAGRIGARVAVVGLETSSTFTVWLTVQPGAPAGVRLLPQDTALYVAHTYPLRANVIDRYANARAERPTVVADSAAATATSAGVVTGQAIGRARFRATWGSFTTTSWASVVPHGTLAAVASYPTRLIRMNLDGSDLHSVETTINYIAWAPSGTRLAVQDYGGPTPYCYYEGYAAVMDTLGGEKQLLKVNDCGNFMEAQRTPRFSHDEQWVYFERARYASGAGGFGSTIYRIHPDGSGLEPVIAPGDTAALGGMDPAPSPSGRYLAYSTFTAYVGPEFHVLDTSTGLTTTIGGVSGARWMQQSDTLVAMNTSTLALVLLRPDGSEARSVPHAADWPGGWPYTMSPDGEWAVVQRGVLELVNLRSGLELPLAFTGGMGAPAWRP